MDMMLAGILVILGVLGATFSKILADEFKAWAPSIAGFVLRAAVARLSESRRERLNEEWLADLAVTPGDVGKIVFAIGCNIAAVKINHPSMRYDIAKRAFDLTFASVAIVALAPLFLIFAIAIRTESTGPVIFMQKRRGLHGREFRILKFRTLRIHSFDYFGASNAEYRVTRVGKYLRQFNLDELPQLFNVLKGDMSIVGPKPHAIAFYRSFKNLEDNSERDTVKPGITGLAQTSVVLDVASKEKDIFRRTSMDNWYVKNRSFMNDMKILWKIIVINIRK